MLTTEEFLIRGQMKNLFRPYPKTKTLFKLEHEPGGKKWSCTRGEILPETAALHYFPLENLVFTEKMDGTNMSLTVVRNIDRRICTVNRRNGPCDPDNKSDWFYWEMAEALQENLLRIPEDLDVVLYGELCGPKIQSGGGYFAERRFLLFDVFDLDTRKFFTWDAVQWLAQETGLETVPEVKYPYPDLDCKHVEIFIEQLMSTYNPDFPAEGVVIRHRKDTAPSNRYMAKIRRKDFGL